MFLHLLSYTHEIYHPIKKEREKREREREREYVRYCVLQQLEANERMDKRIDLQKR